jgi:glutamate-ammonia-ligase adenylyltransferase
MTLPAAPFLQSLPDAVLQHVSSLHHAVEESLQGASLQDRHRAAIGAREDALRTLLLGSDYAAEKICRLPLLWCELLESGDLDRVSLPGEMAGRVATSVTGACDEQALMVALRRCRHREMIRILWRDLNRLAPLAEIMRDLSDLADACIDAALMRLWSWMTPVWGTPRDSTGNRMPMIVFAMGKHGARELNLSSDIDLMFAFSSEGDTSGGSKSVSHEEFFTRLGQKLIRVLNENTAEGFVFRVDMRLRPWGDAGALAMSADAMETYYEQQGREWERYAMVKARPVGRDHGHGAQLLQNLRPFVYRRYVDFGVIESLREMKGMIEREVLRRGHDDNIKTGAGGIREIEFILQALQLIRGGQEKLLRETSTLKVLDAVDALGLLPMGAVQVLRDAYVFLRELEHRIQALKDKQTQILPADTLSQERVARMMGQMTWLEFLPLLDGVRASVRTHFRAFIAEDDASEASRKVPLAAIEAWLGEPDADVIGAALSSLGFSDVTEPSRLLLQMRNSRAVTQMQPLSRQRLDKLMPMLIVACGVDANSRLALLRCLPLVEQILRRSAYMALLIENPRALAHLARLFGASLWVAETMTRYPLLLDTLLNAATLFQPPSLADIRDELRQHMLRIPEDDLERQMEALRQFKLTHVLRVAASDIAGSLPIMKVSDYLTWLAESLLQTVFEIAWRQMVDKHGLPQKAPGIPCSPDFIIVGYGKVGGIELSYSSDLDLVFVHDADSQLETDGERSIDNSTFFARLGQKIIHLLTARTPSGMLYETDMRLRPSGNAGLLVSSLQAFDKYQRETAWTWEHQALVRARVLAGCPGLAVRFAEVRQAILGLPREPAVLVGQVEEMRHKMIDHLSKSHTDVIDPALLVPDRIFDLKQDPGGIVDIEFIAQYLVLRHAADHPEMARWTDNVRILETAESLGLMPAVDAGELRAAYLAYRTYGHHAALQAGKAVVPGDQFVQERLAVRRIWAETIRP